MTSAQSAERDHWLIPTERYDCIVSNIDKYLATKKDPILIFVSDCPATDIAEIMAKRTQNALPAIKSGPAAAEGWDQAIVFSRGDLDCLKTKARPQDKAIIAISKKPCL